MAPNKPQGVAPPVDATPRPAPRDNRDLDRYLAWLEFVEKERNNLRAIGETSIFHAVANMYKSLIGGVDDPQYDDRQALAAMQRTVNETVQRMALIRANILKTRPPVPRDCVALDQFYMAAVNQEWATTTEVLRAYTAGNIGAIRSAGNQGVSNIETYLGRANLELENVYKGRGLNPLFRIQTGRNSSMLGGLSGLPGFGGL